MKKKIIFHIPNYIDEKKTSGSQIRPMKMLNAFINVGYEVDTVMGYGQERKKSIKLIKYKIKQGVKYDFAYSESSTMPTLLTEKHHFPTKPFLDFGFFQFLKNHQIGIGLFYRDIHWRFKQYEKVSFHKRAISILFYHYDICQYNHLLNILFLPSSNMAKSIPNLELQQKIYSLPPGCQIKSSPDSNDKKQLTRKFINRKFKLLYVGGILPPLYDLRPMIQMIKNTHSASLTLVCRQQEWLQFKNDYKINELNNIDIIHACGHELDPIYAAADIFVIVWRYNPYLDFAMPVKLFEALGYGLPIITSAGSAVARFVKENDVGWIVSNSDELSQLISYLQNNLDELMARKKRVKQIRHKHTWSARAETVAKVLTKRGNICK